MSNKKVLCLHIILIFAIFGCGKERIITKSRFLMDTFVEVKVLHDDPVFAERAAEAALKEIERLEGIMGFYDEGTELWRINNRDGRIRISDDMMEVVKTSLRYSKKSGGAFDITVGPLMRVWGFGGKRGNLPSPYEIKKALGCVGYERVRLDEDKKTIELLGDGMMIDLGGVATGYAVMKACKVLREMGISSALINAGGDIQVIGNRPWRIGIQHPRRKRDIVGILLLSDEAVATSGDYERYFIHNGIRYHHILDPRTGYPARDCISVTIISKDAFLSDILSTCVFVLGKKEGLSFIKGMDGVEAIIITKDGIFWTQGVKERLLGHLLWR